MGDAFAMFSCHAGIRDAGLGLHAERFTPRVFFLGDLLPSKGLAYRQLQRLQRCLANDLAGHRAGAKCRDYSGRSTEGRAGIINNWLLQLYLQVVQGVDTFL